MNRRFLISVTAPFVMSMALGFPVHVSAFHLTRGSELLAEFESSPGQ